MLLSAYSAARAASKRMQPCRVMSFNVRTSAMDGKDGDNCWDNRKAVVADIVLNHRPAVCGMQVRSCFDSNTPRSSRVIPAGQKQWQDRQGAVTSACNYHP